MRGVLFIMNEKIRIVAHNEFGVLDGNQFGDWIDLKVAQDYSLKKGDFEILNLGVSMEIPAGYEAHLVPRSSTFKKYGILQTNGVGIIDNDYSGTDDIWGMPVYATRDIEITKGTRIAQFRIIRKQPDIHFEYVDELENPNRGGFGSTGD